MRIVIAGPDVEIAEHGDHVVFTQGGANCAFRRSTLRFAHGSGRCVVGRLLRLLRHAWFTNQSGARQRPFEG